MSANLMVIDDDVALCTAINRLLNAQGYRVRVANSGEDGLALCQQEMPSLVLLDLSLPGIDGLETLRRIKQMDRACRVVMITAYDKARSVVDAVKLGADDYVTKPLPMEELRVLVAKLVGQSAAVQPEAGVGLGAIVGKSPAIGQVFEMVRRISGTSSTVLVTGESGTGKELVSRAVHLNSDRADQPFLSINCVSIPASLLESELFGYEKGAFTDAKAQKRGLIEVAGSGTLLLDEIGLMPIDLQGKILTVLETRKFRRVGGMEEITAESRFIAATNRDLEKAVRSGEFREDLYYRLNVIPIHLPPLRERGDDALLLARHFLDEYSRRHQKPRRDLSREAEALLRAYSWPGNVRELKNVIERAVLLTDGPTIDAPDLSVDRRSRGRGPGRVASLEVSEKDAIHVSFPSWGLSLNQVERQVIEKALHHTGGNVSRAAKLLHVSRYTLMYRMRKHGIDFQQQRQKKT
jgi:two-component system NtrC family response regulator